MYSLTTWASVSTMQLRLGWKRAKRFSVAVKLFATVLVVAIPTVYVFFDTTISSFGHSSSFRQPFLPMDGFNLPIDQNQQQMVLNSEENWKNGTLFRSKPMVLLSIDYHQSPVEDLVDLIGPLGVRFMQKGIMTYGCQFFKTCRTTGSWIKDWMSSKMFHLLMNGSWKWSFYNKYHADPDWIKADAFLCFHPSWTCELFTPFNKPIIVLSTIRVDDGFHSPWTRRSWLDTLRANIAADSRNVIAANNRFDVEYTRYFTGLNVTLLPSYCGYTRTSYSPTRAEFLLYRPRRAESFTKYFTNEWKSVYHKLGYATSTSAVKLVSVNDLYRHHTFKDLASHRGIVFLPVQPSMMAIFEQYRMNIPLFFPSRQFLVDLQLNHNILSEVNLFGVHARWLQSDESQVTVPQPYENDNASLSYWLDLCDWYSLPYVHYYESVEHLANLLNKITDRQLLDVSRLMQHYNEQFRQQLIEKWQEILLRVANSSGRNL